MIKIHYDFSDGTELSYAEGLLKRDNFSTHCLQFFKIQNTASDVIIIDKQGNELSRNKLLFNDSTYTSKEIRAEHNILKMFVAGAFDWRKMKNKS